MRRRSVNDTQTQTLLPMEARRKRPFWKRLSKGNEQIKSKRKESIEQRDANEKHHSTGGPVGKFLVDPTTSSGGEETNAAEPLQTESQQTTNRGKASSSQGDKAKSGVAPEELKHVEKRTHPSRTRKSERNSKARAILSRSFSRTSLPPEVGRKWVVEVSPAEWDTDEYRWKYRILVQRRVLDDQIDVNTGGIKSFTAAFTWRSLADFVWLENALRAEFHGALLLPLLSVAIGTPDVTNIQYEVEASLLRDWLGDVLNGVRGQGELVLSQGSVDLMGSEALEAFLYRNTDPLPITDQKPDSGIAIQANKSALDTPWSGSPVKEVKEASFVDSLWTKPFSCLPIDTICAGDAGNAPGISPPRKGLARRLPLDIIDCKSRALGDAKSLEIQDSFVEYNPEPLESSDIVIHSDLLEAQRDLVALCRRGCIRAMERLRSLSEDEVQVGAAWKRFAISLSNLFSYEKDVENSRVGGKKERDKDGIAYRKLDKGAVDDLLRVIARQKYDRSTPGLRVLESMLGAYAGDLSAVDPSISAYSEGVKQSSALDDMPQTKPELPRVDRKIPGWQESLRSLPFFGGVEVKKASNSFQTVTTATSSTAGGEPADSHRRAYQARVARNERLLRESLTTLCRATPVRGLRMAFKFFSTEASQATLLSSAAISLRTKVNIADKAALGEIKMKHKREAAEDDKDEIAVVQRILDIGKATKFMAGIQSAPQSKEGALRDKAFASASERLGKWDSHLALAIMEAVGIEDAEVQVEETTRDLRLARRHAIGLRENLGRCVEAVAVLKSAILQGDHESSNPASQKDEALVGKPVQICRLEFVDQLTLVLSGSVLDGSRGEKRPKSAPLAVGLLDGAERSADDPAGWLLLYDKTGKKAKCGPALVDYFSTRDSGVEPFLDELSRLLEAYQSRVESIESFVYMQCVGIQLEKHFSKKRSEALAAFEKKTDITTAINIATKKRLPLLVKELESKLHAVVPNVTHTTVKEAKEAHLLSKTLKTELGAIAMRRFQRARETAMERMVEMMTVWATYEEVSASRELKGLGKAVDELEKSIKLVDISADGISHLVHPKKPKARAGPGAVEA